jgi:hypothetical protein
MKPEPPDVSGDPVAERILKYKPKEKAPEGYNRMVESLPGGFVITKRVETSKEAEKAKV